jgi:hypothetical protein
MQTREETGARLANASVVIGTFLPMLVLPSRPRIRFPFRPDAIRSFGVDGWRRLDPHLSMNAIEAMTSLSSPPRKLVITRRNVDSNQVHARFENSGLDEARRHGKRHLYQPFHCSGAWRAVGYGHGRPRYEGSFYPSEIQRRTVQCGMRWSLTHLSRGKAFA